jgi:hypothetical protein
MCSALFSNCTANFQKYEMLHNAVRQKIFRIPPSVPAECNERTSDLPIDAFFWNSTANRHFPNFSKNGFRFNRRSIWSPPAALRLRVNQAAQRARHSVGDIVVVEMSASTECKHRGDALEKLCALFVRHVYDRSRHDFRLRLAERDRRRSPRRPCVLNRNPHSPYAIAPDLAGR